MSPVKERTEVLEELRESFKRTMAAIRRLRGRETHGAGELSFAQYGLLLGLAQRDELPAGELAALADLSPATVTQLLDGLESAGLVARVRSERDKRVVLVSLTEAGRSLMKTRGEWIDGLWREALEEFSERELAAAGAVLDRLHDLFEQIDAEPRLTV